MIEGHPSREGGARDRGPRSWPLIAALAVVSIAAVVAAARSVAGGWEPLGDEAVVATRSLLVWRGDIPLVGMPTSLDQYSGVWSHHPGPLLFWWMAAWTAALGPAWGAAFGATALNLASVATSAWAGRRIGGPQLGGAALVATGVSIVAADPNGMLRPLNTSITVAAMFAALMLSWATLQRVGAAPWLLIVAASFVAQAHVAYAPVVMVPAIGALGVHVARSIGRRRIAELLALAGLTVILWAGPIVDAALHRGGNVLALWQTVTSSSVPTEGVGPAIVALAGITTLLPAWRTDLGNAPDPIGLANVVRLAVAMVAASWLVSRFRSASVRGRRDLAGAATFAMTLLLVPASSMLAFHDNPFEPTVSAAAVVASAGIALLAVWTLRRGRRTANWGLLVVALGLAGGGITASTLPAAPVERLQVLWVAPLTSFTWLVVAACGAYWLRDHGGIVWSPCWTAALLAGPLLLVTLHLAKPVGTDPTRHREADLTRVIGQARKPVALVLADDERPLWFANRSVDADRALQVFVADRLRAGKPTATFATNYWGEHRSPYVGAPIDTLMIVTDRGAPAVAGLKTIYERADPRSADRTDLASEVAALWQRRDQQVELQLDGPDGLAEALDGRLPGSCENLEDYRNDPSLIADRAPEAVLELYRRGWVRSPLLPDELARRVADDEPRGLWVHQIEASLFDLAELAPTELVLNRTGCG